MSKVSVKVRARHLLQIVEKQRFRCALTGRELTPDNACPDHIVPISRGGDPCGIDNLQVLAQEVNQAKGNMLLDEFVQMCREVVAWADGEHE